MRSLLPWGLITTSAAFRLAHTVANAAPHKTVYIVLQWSTVFATSIFATRDATPRLSCRSCRSPEPRTYAGISKISVPRRDTWEDERDLRLRLIGAFFRGSTPQFGNQLGLVGSIRAQFEHGSSVEAILGNHRCGRCGCRSELCTSRYEARSNSTTTCCG